ncbi:nestin isoform X4 [Fundulus heteroclitus]|uniref:nestin isoform X4 n=1 Tax=Fundulus heteroclitus TaxID=8078 RepID=UPI00165C572D|nr:nestin isoform X4 [Fundulus heteroclitus]
MSSVQHLREFIRERLTAAAEEIFSEVEKTIVRYEEDARLLESCWRPQIKLPRIDLQKPHVSMEEEASSIQQLCNQRRRSCHDQEEAEPQWCEEEQMESDPPLTEEQGEPEHPWIKEEKEEPEPQWSEEEQMELKPPLIEKQGEPVPLWIKEEREEPEPPLIKEENVVPESSLAKEEQREPEPQIEQQEKPELPLIKEEKEEPDYSRLKHEQHDPEYLITRQEDVCSSHGGEQLVQKHSIALRETFTLQESEREARTEQLSFHISPVVEPKGQEGSSSTGPPQATCLHGGGSFCHPKALQPEEKVHS